MMRKIFALILLLSFTFGLISQSRVQFRNGAISHDPTVTTTSAGNLTLVATSDQVQIFTGAAIHTMTLPDATTLINGRWFQVYGQSTGLITVVNDNGDTICTVEEEELAKMTLQSNTSNSGVWICRVLTEEGKIDHGNLVGLLDDDHTQYLTTGRGDTRYFPRTSFVESFTGLQSEPILTGPGGLIKEDFLPVGTAGAIIRSIQEDGVTLTDRTVMNFDQGIIATDDGAIFQVNLDVGNITNEQETVATGDFIAFQVATANSIRKVDYDTLQAAIVANSRNYEELTEASDITSGDFVAWFDTTDDQVEKSDWDDFFLGQTVSTTLADGDNFLFNENAGGTNRNITVQNMIDEIGERDLENQTVVFDISTGDQMVFRDATDNLNRVIDYELIQAKIVAVAVASVGPSGAANSVWDAVVGSAAQVTAGRATHTTLDLATAAVSEGESIFILPGTFTGDIIIPKQLHIRGAGRGSLIDGPVLIPATVDNVWMEGFSVGATGNVVIATGSSGHVITEFWIRSGGIGAVEDATGDSFILQICEDGSGACDP